MIIHVYVFKRRIDLIVSVLLVAGGRRAGSADR